MRFILVCLAALAMSAQAIAAEEVNIYSAQKEHLIRPLLDAFTEQTGIEVNFTSGSPDALLTRLEKEGQHTPADLLLTVDIGNIYQAKEKGVLQAIESDYLNERIPSHLRGPDGQWYGVAVRARALFYDPERNPRDGFACRYEALSSDMWEDSVLIRSSNNIYNQSLLASLIAHNGAEAAEQWAAGVVRNMAKKPEGGDRDQLRALAVGEGNIAVSNTYYYGLLLNSEDPRDRELAQKITLCFPNQEGRGTHVNIRGGGVAAHAKNKDNAIKLMEFFVSDEGQRFFTNHNYEYPAVPSVEPNETVAKWGEFKQDTLNLEQVGKRNAEAVKIFDRVGWQ